LPGRQAPALCRTAQTQVGKPGFSLRSPGPGLSELSAEAAMLSGQSASWTWPAAHRRDRGHDRLPPQDGHTRGAAAVSGPQPGHRVLPRLDQKQAGSRQFHLRRLAKVQTEMLWACLTYNFQQWIRFTQTSGRTRYHLASVPWRSPTSPHRFNSINPRCNSFWISSAQPPLETVFFTASLAKVETHAARSPRLLILAAPTH
jgi:hypothetical protein